MVGIVEQTRSTNDPNSTLTTASGYDPEATVLDEQKDTVSGRIDSILAKDSPILRNALTRSKQDANRRGLMNSAMAVGAGQQALIETALPIASQDASQSYDANRTSVAARNDALRYGADNLNRLGEIEANTMGQSRLQSERGIIDERIQANQAEIDSRLQAEGGDISSRLQAERGQIDQQLQTAEGAIREQLLTRQGEIDQQLAAQRGQIEGGLAAQQGDITSRLQAERGQIDQQLITAEGAVRQQLLERQGQIDQQLAAQQGQIQSQLQQERGQIDQQLQTAEGAIRENLLIRQGEIDAQLARQQGDIAGSLEAQRGNIQLMLQNADAADRERLLAQQGEIDTQLQELRNDGALEITDVEMQWRNTIQTNQSAAVFFSESATAIGNILANPDIPQAQKQQLINQQRTLLNDGLAVIGAIGDMDLTGLLNFGTGATPIPGGINSAITEYLTGQFGAGFGGIGTA